MLVEIVAYAIEHAALVGSQAEIVHTYKCTYIADLMQGLLAGSPFSLIHTRFALRYRRVSGFVDRRSWFATPQAHRGLSSSKAHHERLGIFQAETLAAR